MDIQNETYSPGEFIFLEGDKDSHFYIIQEGTVEIFTSPSGRYFKITEIGPGESFGEFALLNRAPRSASARAISTVNLVRVSERGFEQMLSELPGWASCMLTNFSRRLKAMNDRLLDTPQFMEKEKV
jgi:CRP/FNR family transcriptional regulator, cyclic AMP receptor protein